MFKVIEITKKICIPCKHFSPDVNLNDLLLLMINKFMHNKVIHNAGLFVVLTGILNVDVLPAIMNTPEVFVSVRFQCMVFTMIEGEILSGIVSETTPRGICLNLKFFRNVFVDPQYLPTPSKFENIKKRWIWIKKIVQDEKEEEYFFPIEVNNEVRFKVLETKFSRFNIINQEKNVEPIMTYGTLKQELLGPIFWWA